MAMVTRYLVTRPSYIGDTLVYPGDTLDASADFVPSAHLVPQTTVLPSDDQYSLVPAPPAAVPAASAPMPRVIVVKRKAQQQGDHK